MPTTVAKSNMPIYTIEVRMGQGEVKYLLIQNILSLVKKQEATLFKSKVLALGWLIKAKSVYRQYKLCIIKI